MVKHKNCNGCLALDRQAWSCGLGYPVLGLSKFTPGEPCPKPTTQAELNEPSNQKDSPT